MIMVGAEVLLFKPSALGLYITVHAMHGKSRRMNPPGFSVYERDYSGNRPSYIINYINILCKIIETNLFFAILKLTIFESSVAYDRFYSQPIAGSD